MKTKDKEENYNTDSDVTKKADICHGSWQIRTKKMSLVDNLDKLTYEELRFYPRSNGK